MSKFCGYCGKSLSDTAKFCAGCGMPVHDAEEVPAVKTAPVSAPPAAPVVPAPAPYAPQAAQPAAPAAPAPAPYVPQTAQPAAPAVPAPAPYAPQAAQPAAPAAPAPAPYAPQAAQPAAPAAPAPAPYAPYYPAPAAPAAPVKKKKKGLIIALAAVAAVVAAVVAVILFSGSPDSPAGTGKSPEDVVEKLGKLYSGTADADEIASLIYEYNYPLDSAQKQTIRSEIDAALERSDLMHADGAGESVSFEVLSSEVLEGDDLEDAISYFGRDCRTDSIDEIRYITVRMALSSDNTVGTQISGFYIKADGMWYINLAAAL